MNSQYTDPFSDHPQNIAGRAGRKKEMNSSTKEKPTAGKTTGSAQEHNEDMNSSRVNGEEYWRVTERPRILGKSANANEIVIVGYMPDALFHALRDDTDITQEMLEEYRSHVYDRWERNEVLETITLSDAEIDAQADIGDTLIKPKSRSWDDLEEAELPQLKIIIDGILNQGAKMTLGGSSKAGKTWLLMDLAFSIATGREWIGFKAHKGEVLYVNLEIQEQFFRKRGISIKHAKGIPNYEKIPNLKVWTLRGHFLTAESFKNSILEEIGGERYDVIIVDPLYKILNGSDANAAGAMQVILSELEQIAMRANAALIYADHFSKGNQANKASIDRISGSGVNARDPDVIATFTEHKEPECLTLQWTLRNFKPVPSIVVSKESEGFLFKRKPDLDPGDLKQAGNEKKFTTQQLLRFLPEEGLDGDEWFNAVNEESGMGKKTYTTLRAELRKADKVYFSKLENVWTKTSKCIMQEQENVEVSDDDNDDE